MENYADVPKTITEIKSDRDMSSQTWTVRDCLIATLRNIDQGVIEPHQLVLIMTTKNKEGEIDITRSTAGPMTTLELWGMLSRALYRNHAEP